MEIGEDKKEIIQEDEIEKVQDVSADVPIVGAKSAYKIKQEDHKSLKKNPRKFVRRERVKNEFDQKILNIRRVTRVVSGGRRFSFSVAIVIGDKKGSVGVGT